MPTRCLVLLLSAGLFLGQPGCRSRCPPGARAFMKRWLDQLCEGQAKALQAPDASWRGLRLARADRPPERTLPRGPLLFLGASTASLGGRPLSDPGNEEALRRGLARTPPSGPAVPLILALAPEVSMSRVATLLGILHRLGVHRFTFLVEPTRSPMLPPPPDSGHQADLERILSGADPQQRETILRRRLALLGHQGSCGPLIPLLDRALSGPAQTRCRTLAQGIPAKVAGCACRVDWRRVLTLTSLLLGPYEFVGQWTGTLTPALGSQDPRRLHVAGDAPWRDLAHRLTALPEGPFELRAE